MERVSEQMASHPVSQLEDPEAVAKISAEIISLEEQVRRRVIMVMVYLVVVVLVNARAV